MESVLVVIGQVAPVPAVLAVDTELADLQFQTLYLLPDSTLPTTRATHLQQLQQTPLIHHQLLGAVLIEGGGGDIVAREAKLMSS